MDKPQKCFAMYQEFDCLRSMLSYMDKFMEMPCDIDYFTLFFRDRLKEMQMNIDINTGFTNEMALTMLGGNVYALRNMHLAEKSENRDTMIRKPYHTRNLFLEYDPDFYRWAFGNECKKFNLKSPIILMEAWNQRHGHLLTLERSSSIYMDLRRLGDLWALHGYPDGRATKNE